MILLTALLFLLQTANPPAAPVPDRDAFTFLEYRLNATPDVPKQSLTVEGDVVLRNDSDAPQTLISLQLSSAFEWTAITLNGKPAAYTTTKFASDLDHTGGVNEAVVTVPAVAPHATLTLHVSYHGTIALDASRLMRLRTPKPIAEQNDWDRITPEYTAFRGVGYVMWYPMALRPASLQDGNRVFTEISEWKERHQESSMTLRLNGVTAPMVWLSSAQTRTQENNAITMTWTRFGIHTPVVTAARFTATRMTNGSLYALQATPASQRYANVMSALRPDGFEDAKVVQPVSLVEAPPWVTPFEADHFLLIPFSTEVEDKSLQINLMHMAAHAYFASPRAWLDEGFAHWAQLRSAETLTGRKTMLASLARRSEILSLADSGAEGHQQPLIRARDEIYFRTKASCVLWLLDDMVGKDAFTAALREYSAAADRNADYFQKLVQKSSGRDLERFFDDWVYRDPGLPDFGVTNLYARQNLKGGFLVTVTVKNTGRASAEVPVFVRAGDVENSARLWVPAGGEASARITMPLTPTGATVNDGSVPELDLSNNDYKTSKGAAATSE